MHQPAKYLIMKPIIALFTAICIFTILAAVTLKKEKTKNTDSITQTEIPNVQNTFYTPEPKQQTAQKIQVAILLDVSGSMNGLIDQAKAQLWNMVNIIGKAKCEGGTPTFEIALYEYGRSSNDMAKGYVKQISPFTTDLDEVSKNLFSLTTNGGDEYCGQVIYTSLNELTWDASANNYKVIFIAGNEDFLQGKVKFTEACELAKAKGIIVNTIYCGDKMQGINEHWNLNGECGGGSYTNINSNAVIDDIPTPYDSTIFSLNGTLNSTYLGYGRLAGASFAKQSDMDGLNYKLSKGAALKRAEVKSQKSVYNNAGWDMVDAIEADSTFITKLDKKTLPDSLKNKTNEELKAVITEKSSQRAGVQKQIKELSVKRQNFITEERAKRASATNTPTLETEIEKIIKEQALKFKMIIN